MRKISTFLLLLSITLSCEAFKVLVVFPLPIQSHGNLGQGVVKHLLKAGHEVTYLSGVPYNNSSPNYRHIDVSGIVKLPIKIDFGAILRKELRSVDQTILIYIMANAMKMYLENEEIQEFLSDPKEQFDVVVAEWMYSDTPSGLAPVFNCPLIYLSSVEPHWRILKLVDLATNPSYDVDAISTYTPPLNLIQRIHQLWIRLKVFTAETVYLDSHQRKIYDEFLAPVILKRGRQPPTFDEVRYNASLVLGNSHVSMGYASSLPQIYKSVGGYHIDDTVEPLPKDLQELMDNAKNGVIYFSMGSNLKSKDLPVDVKSTLSKMLGTLKQTVIWKFEEVLPDLPANVHILKWAPQRSILSHPNCILFVTHGGLLSTTEAIHYGVPIVGIPVFADQFTNVMKAEAKGFAKKVDLSFTMHEPLKAAIEEAVSNPRYSEKAKELSFIYHDRPMKPGDELVHWVQHVVRTRGAPHLRSKAVGMPLYQRLYLDVAVLLILAFMVIKRVYAVFSKNKSVKNKTD